LRGRKLERQAAPGAVSARFLSLSVLQSRGFATQDGHKLLILKRPLLSYRHSGLSALSSSVKTWSVPAFKFEVNCPRNSKTA
jgi:hypothetical protein